MDLKLFDYHLPNELIAQRPAKPRDSARLLVVEPSKIGACRRLSKKKENFIDDCFYNLDKYLDKGDVLVFNNSKVLPARLPMQKETGGKVEVFLLNDLGGGKWEVLIGGKAKENYQLSVVSHKSSLDFKCQILNRLPNGNWVVKFNLKGKKFRQFLEEVGETPLPPYIKTKDSKQIRRAYQTVYAKREGSVAAPTAGLHFTKRLLNKLEKKGVKFEFVTLHVGLGTFQPVKTNKIEEHQMHAEYVILDKKAAERLNNYKRQGRKIIAVGTTSCRVLEAMSDKRGRLRAGNKWVDIFIYPGYKFKFVDGLITNFHLPKSTLLMLVSALAGRRFILRAYKYAIKKKYRFYSFGDGMMIK